MSEATQLFVVVPVRGIADGKSRLATVLDAPARARFNEWLVTRTLTTLRAWRGSLDACSVVSACGQARELARSEGAEALREPVTAGLNAAAAFGSRHASERGYASVLILPCDLPLLDVNALDRFVCEAQHADVGIAPDESGAGTNALVVPAHAAFDFCFGADSCESHARAAAACGLTAIVHRAAQLAFDIDTPDDYARWRAAHGASVVKPMV